MNIRDLIARIVAANDQDREACREWIKNATLGERVEVWNTIQRQYDDPRMEVMSRFAQLAFGEMTAEHEAEIESRGDVKT